MEVKTKYDKDTKFYSCYIKKQKTSTCKHCNNTIYKSIWDIYEFEIIDIIYNKGNVQYLLYCKNGLDYTISEREIDKENGTWFTDKERALAQCEKWSCTKEELEDLGE